MTKKQGGKIACGQCHKFFKEDELILDEVNNRYLCEGCYEPRDDEDKDIDNGEEIDDGPDEGGDCGGDLIDDEPEIDDEPINNEDKECKATRGEARIKREARTNRERPSRNLLMDLKNL